MYDFQLHLYRKQMELRCLLPIMPMAVCVVLPKVCFKDSSCTHPLNQKADFSAQTPVALLTSRLNEQLEQLEKWRARGPTFESDSKGTK